MLELEQHVIFVRAAAAPFLDFLIHRARYHVAAGQVFRVRRVALHETLAARVDQVAALAAHAFGNEYAGTGHTGRVELPKLHIFQRDARARHHAETIAGVDERIGAGLEDAPGAAGGKDGSLRLEDHRLARLHLQRHHTQHITMLVTNQIERQPLDEEMRALLDVTLIQRVQHRMPGAVCRRARAAHRFALAELRQMPAEGALIKRAVGVAVERHAEVFEFVHDLRRHAAHELNGVLIAQVVRTFNGIEHVPMPVVLLHIAERGTDSPLRRHSVRARGKHF